MHRWFFMGDEIAIEKPTPPSTPVELAKTSSLSSLLDSDWTFCVKCDRELCSSESLAVCGSIPALGRWNPNKCLLLAREENSTFWSLTVSLPRKYVIQYRYLICALTANGKKVLRFWEPHYESRLISRYQTQCLNDNAIYETFGFINDKFKVERGWIDSYLTVVQFKFYHEPFELNTIEEQTELYVKISTLKLIQQETCCRVINEKSSSKDSLKLWQKCETKADLKSAFAFCEVALLHSEEGEFHKQPKYGTPCGANDVLIFNITMDNFQQTGYVIDLYKYSPKAGSDVPPYHVGYQHVLPHELKGSDGILNLKIMCAIRHRPIGCMKCDYLVIKPLCSYDFTMEKNYSYWDDKSMGLYIGHRGSGKSFWYKNDILRENTIDAFKRAFEHGADMVEFDVQLTEDRVAVIYHDFQLYISKVRNLNTREYDVMNLPLTRNEITSLRPFCRHSKGDVKSIPLNKFAIDQLKRVKFYEPPDKGPETPCLFEVKNNRPFTTLQEALSTMDCKLGFFIEVKWPQKFQNGSTQESFIQHFDRNEYVDIILNEVLKSGGSRRIIFVSYEADICTMIRLKQNHYPVVYMIHDILTDNTVAYWDPRGNSIHSGIYFAKKMELLGISVNCDDISKLPEIVSATHEKDLALFTWGSALRLDERRLYFKKLGVDGIICDRILNVLEPEDLKGTIFLIDLINEPLETNKTECGRKTDTS